MTPTTIIIPSSRKMTSQSIPNSVEWKASSEETSRKPSIRAAPARATTTRLTFSLAIST